MNHSIKTARGTFNVKLYGNPTDPALILVHGWPQTSYCWHHAINSIKGFYIIAPDIRGMGDSNRELDLKLYEKDELAKDIFTIADELGIHQFNVGGHDWGGAIVQEMAFLSPARIKRLIILNMVIINNVIGQSRASEVLVKTLFRSSWYQFLMSIKNFPEELLTGKEEVWIRFFSRGISNPIPENAIKEYIRCFKIKDSITTTSNLYRTTSLDKERWKNYEDIIVEIPTLIIHGILDPVIIKEYVIGVENCFSNVKIEKINGGHFIVDEQPEKVGRIISDFVA